ncbi:hypothetical protein EPI10_014168 [Gossypium australe]|uniref:Uncharacterized protein n=1 Tax=Gossypium australe TaxID=47621 RepID=A0A5B6VGG6_9ROSI|nr:hypothetical protein EPI10_014168 [Gossypium australe]
MTHEHLVIEIRRRVVNRLGFKSSPDLAEEPFPKATISLLLVNSDGAAACSLTRLRNGHFQLMWMFELQFRESRVASADSSREMDVHVSIRY